MTNTGATFTISIVGSTVTVSASDAQYNGAAHGGTASWSSTGGDGEGAAISTITYTGRNTTVYNSTTAPTAAGDYRASASFAGNANHTGSNNFADYSITRKPVTVTTANAGKAYGDGDPSPLTSANLGGFVASDNIDATFS
ncbi:MAG: hypothetical protein LC750_15160, partial [Actinobacteria bacterium]|nr:hypothetical protein [Actinomycetota bacterium]